MRYLLALAVVLMNVNAVWAQDTATPNAEGVKYNAFGVPNTVITTLDNSGAETKEETNSEEVKFPDCKDASLLEQVQKQVALYQQKNPAVNIYNRRRQILIAKNTGGFENLDIATIKPQEHFEVASRTIMLKINQGMKETKMKVCRGNNPIIDRHLYLLMFPTSQGINIDILNLSSEATDKPQVSFLYK